MLTGPEIAVDGTVSLTLPEGFEDADLGIATTAEGRSLEGTTRNQVQVTTFPMLASGGAVTLDDLEDAAVRSPLWDERPNRLDRVEVDGVEMSHLRGTRGTFEIDQFTAVRGEEQVNLTFAYDVGFTSAARQRELYESILATVVWE